MTDNEIIKALECCSDDCGKTCEGMRCPMIAECQTDINALKKSALALINRQKAEIERLKCSAIRNGKQIGSLIHHLETAKSEAYREFADKLHDNFISKVQKHYCRLNTEHSYKYTEGYTADDVLSTIVNTLEELTRNSHGTCTESNE